MSLVEINTDEAGKKLQVVSKFPFQIISIVFGVAIVYLFMAQQSLGNEFRGYVIDQGREQIQAISGSTRKISENTNILIDVKGVLQQNQEYLKQNQEYLKNLKKIN